MKVPAHRIAAWEAATYPNVVANLAARADSAELKRVCELWVKARGRDAAEGLWRDVVAAKRQNREGA